MKKRFVVFELPTGNRVAFRPDHIIGLEDDEIHQYKQTLLLLSCNRWLNVKGSFDEVLDVLEEWERSEQ